MSFPSSQDEVTLHAAISAMEEQGRWKQALALLSWSHVQDQRGCLQLVVLEIVGALLLDDSDVSNVLLSDVI